MSLAYLSAVWWILIALAVTAIIIVIALILPRLMFGFAFRTASRKLMTQEYEGNLLELLVSLLRAKIIPVMENNLRAEGTTAISRPIGGPSAFPDFCGLAFNVVQLATLTTPNDVPIDSAVVLGKASARPLRLDIPIMISGMGYGIALSEPVKLALATGAAQAGTATNTGEGPYLQSEREAARYLIYQYGRAEWTHNLDAMRECDMVEIQLGQGAWGGVHHSRKHHKLSPKARQLMGLEKGQDAIVNARLPGMTRPEQLAELVTKLRQITDGLPIAVKIAAGWTLEEDLKWIVDAGADVVVVDGGQGGGSNSIPALQEHFGLPTVAATRRAHDFLVGQSVRERVGLIMSGGLRTPGDYLKALALGADAVAIGTMAIFAVSHTQILQAILFEPPTQLVYDSGRMRNKFSVKKGSQYLTNYLMSCTDEMKQCARALGKAALNQVTRQDLYALDEATAKITGVPYVGDRRSGEETSSPGSSRPQRETSRAQHGIRRLQCSDVPLRKARKLIGGSSLDRSSDRS